MRSTVLLALLDAFALIHTCLVFSPSDTRLSGSGCQSSITKPFNTCWNSWASIPAVEKLAARLVNESVLLSLCLADSAWANALAVSKTVRMSVIKNGSRKSSYLRKMIFGLTNENVWPFLSLVHLAADGFMFEWFVCRYARWINYDVRIFLNRVQYDR